MATDEIQVKFTCKECGGTVLHLPDDHTDDSIVTCKSCGIAHGRWGDVKAKAIQAVKDHVINTVKDVFKDK